MARVLLLLQDGFDDEDVQGVKESLIREGHDVVLVGPERGATVTGEGGTQFVCDRDPLHLDLNTAHAVVVPGGPGADALVDDKRMENVVYTVAHKGHIVVGIGRGVRILPSVAKQKSPNPIATGTKILDADLVKGRQVTGHPDVREELEKAGAKWSPGPVVADGILVTARSAHGADLERLIEELAALLPLAERAVVSRIL